VPTTVATSWKGGPVDDIGARVRNTIAEHLRVPVSNVTDTARFDADLGATSKDNIEMIMVLEEVFGVDISDTAAEEMLTVGDVIAFMKRKQSV